MKYRQSNSIIQKFRMKAFKSFQVQSSQHFSSNEALSIFVDKTRQIDLHVDFCMSLRNVLKKLSIDTNNLIKLHNRLKFPLSFPSKNSVSHSRSSCSVQGKKQ